jgi:hypothetical protein
MANSNYSRSRSTKQKQGKNLVLARSGLLYGLTYVKVKEEKISSNRGITSTPNFLFYDNNTKVMIDFSDYNNTTSADELYSFWNLIIDGMAFTITDGELINPANKQQYDVSGTYTFTSIENLVVFADVVSVESISTGIHLYNKNDFSNLPTFTLATIIEPEKTTPLTSIVNNLGKNTKNSFNFLGIKVGDYVQLQSKQSKFEIVDYSLDSEGKEVITVFGEIAEEDRISTKTFIGLYVEKKNENTVSVDITDEKIGACEVLENNIVISCTSNNTASQCELRSTTSLTARFTESKACTTAIEEEQTSTDLLSTIIDQQNTLISKMDSRVQTISTANFQNMPFR